MIKLYWYQTINQFLQEIPMKVSSSILFNYGALMIKN